MLYKRAFRKEKEVVTFLIKAKMIKLAFNLRIEPRRYQSEATEWALAKGQAVCSLPTGTGKTLVAVLWLKSLFEADKINNALILEPTRLLVNQTSDYFGNDVQLRGK